MTDIKVEDISYPTLGSKWTGFYTMQNVQVTATYEDPDDGPIVVYKALCEDGTHYHDVYTRSTFLNCFKPLPKPKKKMQQWINLYADGAGISYNSYQEAKNSVAPMGGGEYIETRLIEWYVNQD